MKKYLVLGTVVVSVNFSGISFAADSATAPLSTVTSYSPHIDPANFKRPVSNPYFPLVPGVVTAFVEKSEGEVSEVRVEVTDETKTIMGVPCTVVHDRVTVDGKIKEDTYDWYAADNDGNVWYFGEATKEYGDNGRVSTKGSWQAGVNGARPGIVMPAKAVLTEPYRQEYLSREAEDMGQIVELNQTVSVAFGKFDGCIRTDEWIPLSDQMEKKWYCKGIGFTREEKADGEIAELMSVTSPAKKSP